MPIFFTCEQVVVSTLLTIQPSVVFPCGQWLARDMGDGETVRTLTPHSLTNKENSREDYGKVDCKIFTLILS